MSDAFKTTSMLAWTRRLVGWLDDRNFVCVRKKPTTVKLTPVGTKGGTKGAVLRIGRRRAYVLDAHSKGGDQTCPDAGVLLYGVNGNVDTGYGPIRVIDATPGDGGCGPHTSALFKPANAGVAHFRNSRISFTVLGRSGNGFRVRVRTVG